MRRIEWRDEYRTEHKFHWRCLSLLSVMEFSSIRTTIFPAFNRVFLKCCAVPCSILRWLSREEIVKCRVFVVPTWNINRSIRAVYEVSLLFSLGLVNCPSQEQKISSNISCGENNASDLTERTLFNRTNFRSVVRLRFGRNGIVSREDLRSEFESIDWISPFRPSTDLFNNERRFSSRIGLHQRLTVRDNNTVPYRDGTVLKKIK
jgi:hypothetical protein